MEADEKTKTAVLETMSKYMEIYAHRNMSDLKNIFTSDPDLIAIGTGEDEWVNGINELEKGMKRDIAQSENIKIVFEDVNISAADSVAWIACKMLFHAEVEGEMINLKGRLTAVLEKRANRFYFQQIHFSVPLPEQELGSSYPSN